MSILNLLAKANALSIDQIKQGILNQTIPSYIGMGLIDEKTKQAKEAAAILAGQKAQGQPPVGEQVMQAADQVTRPVVPPTPTPPAARGPQPAPTQMAEAPQGIEGAQSNLPVKMAGGGIVAFADGDLVEGDDSLESRMVQQAAGYSPDGGDMWSTPGTGTLALMGDKEKGIRSLIQRAQLEKAAASNGPVGLPGTRGRGAFAGEPIAATRGRGATYVPDAPLEFGKSVPMPNAPLRSADMSPLPNARLPDGFDKFLADGAKKPPEVKPEAKPETKPTTSEIKTKDGELAIQRGVNEPTPAQAAKEESSGGDEFSQFMDRQRAERDEYKNMILGMRDSRAQAEKDNVSNALLRAGLGMAAARSPWAITNIAEGGISGLDAYTKGADEIAARDDKIVNQLVSMGYKGQELEQAAAKYGVDLEQLKAQKEVWASQAAENRARAGLAPLQGQLYGAQAAHTLAETNKTTLETALMPTKLELEKMKVAEKNAYSRGASSDYIKDANTKRDAYLSDPLSFPQLTDNLRDILTKEDHDSSNYKAAVAAAKQQILEQYYTDLQTPSHFGASRRAAGNTSED